MTSRQRYVAAGGCVALAAVIGEFVGNAGWWPLVIVGLICAALVLVDP